MKVRRRREILNFKTFKFLKTWVSALSQWNKCNKEKNNLNKDKS